MKTEKQYSECVNLKIYNIKYNNNNNNKKGNINKEKKDIHRVIITNE